MATLTEFTDPFCTWSWGAEPLLRQVEEAYPAVEVDFVMGGLVEDFEEFHDERNDISAPADVAPHWEEAAAEHGMPVDADVWRTDPPNSSYPSNVAYAAATFQDEALAKTYLRRLREAFAAERRNIERTAELVALAAEVGLDPEQFREDYASERARELFRQHRDETRESGATVFPSFRVAGPEGSRLLRGSQPFEAVSEALEAVDPGLERTDPRPLEDFLAVHGRVATAEVAAVYDLDLDAARERLRRLEADGLALSLRRGSGVFWEPS